MATYMFFGVGDYEYSNYVNLYNYDSRVVGVRVKASIRDTVESGLSAIPSTVTYNGVTYTVKYLYANYPSSGTAYGTWDGSNIGPYGGAFEGCKKLTSVPTFPPTIDYTYSASTWSLFRMCYALTNPPALPSGVTRMSNTYSYCPITTAPAIPQTATEMTGVFWVCKQLVNAPTIPPSVTSLDTTFASCTALETAPEIPASVTNMRQCFSGCTSLTGNIVVNNQITEEYNYRNVFYNTVNDIYIMNGGTAGSVWKDAIAPSYSNVHYEADDHPAPSLSSFSATRVASNGSTTPAERGLWVYLSAQANISTDYLPVGWASEFGSTTVEMDGTTITPTWTASASTGTITLTAWVNINDLSAHTFTLSISELIKEGTTTKKTLTTAMLTATLPKAYALVDYYHDPATGTEGMAVGKYAEHADLFDVAMDATFEADATFKDANGAMRLLFDFIHPIGSYYETSDTAFNPNVTWGGTWELETQGQVHVSAGTGYAVAGALTNTTDGGESTHTLNVNEIPAHNHGGHNAGGAGTATSNFGFVQLGVVWNSNATDGNRGGGRAHNNMQPYIVVNRWHRTA